MLALSNAHSLNLFSSSSLPANSGPGFDLLVGGYVAMLSHSFFSWLICQESHPVHVLYTNLYLFTQWTFHGLL